MSIVANLTARIANRRFGTAAVYMAATVLARAGAFLLIPLYTRRLSLAEYGDYALAQTMLALLSTPLALSLHQAVARFYFDSKDVAASEERAGGAARWLVAVTLANAALLQVVILIARPPGSEGIFGRWDLSCILWGSAGAAIGQVPSQYMRVSQRPFGAAGFQLTEFFVTIGAGLLMVLSLNRGGRGAIEAAAMAGAFNGSIGVVFVLARLKGAPTVSLLKDALRFSMPFIPHAAANQLQFVTDRWILKISGFQTALGAFSLATQLTTPVAMAVEAWHQASGPVMGEAARAGGRAAIAQRSTAFQRSYFLVALAAGVAVCAALPLASFVVGPNFRSALWIVPLTCVIITIESFYFSNAVIAFYCDKPASIPKVTIPAGVLNLLLNAALIPLLGGVPGALLARAISMTFRSGAMWWLARGHLRDASSTPGLS